MKVGEYCRTDKGEIGKLEDLKLEYTNGKRLVTYYTYKEVKENLVVFDNKKITQRFVDGSSIYLTDDELKYVEESIVKSSPNIIDLIEENDFINQIRVSEIIKKTKDSIRFMADSDYECSTELKEEEIETILTKEQFESMEYKVKE